ncbi:MAG TPA: hypothetical protein PKZ84_23975 [Anaerolineae bacterium]|nr:hypothetical protein [Anaerolineae bacterium]HQI87128.1 hypothetical protein [Anaerolineae bacterium]
MSIKTFDNLAQRVVNGWIATMPDFVPVSSIPVSETAQRQFSAFLRGVAQTVQNHPEYLGLPIQPDDAYEFGELQNRRPELIDTMKRMKRKVDDFVTLLLKMGVAGVVEGQTLRVPKADVNLNATLRARLAHFGLTAEAGKTETDITCDAFPEMFPAWVWLAADAVRTAPSAGPAHVPPVRFSRCLYSESYPYTKDILFRLADDCPGLPALVDFLEKEGYTLVCNRDNQINVDWVKSYGKADEPLKGWWGERTHGGLAFEYDWIRKNPLLFGLRIPEFKTLLQHFDAMPEQVKAFVVQHTKHCDTCGYCTQTDKTGKRPRAFMTVEYNGQHALCTMFPGFGYTWQNLDETVAADIQAFLTFTDEVLTQR